MAHTTAIDYLDKALSIIQTKAQKSATVDWTLVRAKCFELAAGAMSTAGTYPAINYALSQLKDKHSFLIVRSATGKSSAAQSLPQTKIHDRVECKGILRDSFKQYGFIVVGEFENANSTAAATKYAKSLQQQIAQISTENPCGWIVDLRGNTGGNMWPMIVGVGPLIGAGTIGFFQYKDKSVPWFYEDGQAGLEHAMHGKHANFRLHESLPDCANIPVAVLIDPATASSGEALAISFQGRPNTRFIGQHTCGLSTANETIQLPDGAVLALTTSIEADRNLVPYPAGIAPDITVERSDIPYGHKNDPAIKAAFAWFREFATVSGEVAN